MKKWIAGFAVAGTVLLFVYAFMTPVGMLRTLALVHGFPVEAVTMRVREAEPADVGVVCLDNPEGSTIYHIYENAPYAWVTDTVMENWIIYRHGPFYTVEYYGYC